MLKSDKCMGILNYWGGALARAAPKSTPMLVNLKEMKLEETTAVLVGMHASVYLPIFA